jgi:hypothetical protein
MSRFADRADVPRTVADDEHGATSAADAEPLPAHAEDYRLTPEPLMSLTRVPGGAGGTGRP